MNAIRLAVMTLALGVGSAALASEATETRNVSNFHKIALKGSVDVKVKEGSGYSVQVIARDDVIKKIETTVSDDTLEISMQSSGFHFSMGDSGKEEVDVTLPRIDALSIHGSGDALSIELNGNHDFALSISGSGDAKVHGSANKASVVVSGSGDVTWNGGSAAALEVEVNGSGDVDAKELPAKDVSVEVHGSGDVRTTVNGGAAHLSTSGSGDIDWYGTASNVDQRSHGSGDINHHG